MRDFAEANETTLAELCFHWVVMAATLAQNGYGHLLPQEKRARRNSLGEVAQVRWAQGAAEFERCRTAIEAAGSSITTVLREASASYVAAGGDHLAMSWPNLRRRARKSAVAEAA